MLFTEPVLLESSAFAGTHESCGEVRGTLLQRYSTEGMYLNRNTSIYHISMLLCLKTMTTWAPVHLMLSLNQRWAKYSPSDSIWPVATLAALGMEVLPSMDHSLPYPCV